MADLDDEQPLHPEATRCLSAVEAHEDGAKSSIPLAKMNILSAELGRKKDDRSLFEHLCVISYRLNTVGLTAAAKQLLMLARIGLTAAQVEETLKNTDEVRTKAAQMAASANALKSGSKLAGGLAPNAAPKGLSMKLGPKKK